MYFSFGIVLVQLISFQKMNYQRAKAGVWGILTHFIISDMLNSEYFLIGFLFDVYVFSV